MQPDIVLEPLELVAVGFDELCLIFGQAAVRRVGRFHNRLALVVQLAEAILLVLNVHVESP